MVGPPVAHNVLRMSEKTDQRSDGRPELPDPMFSHLRERNEYARRVAERVQAQRARHLEQVIQAQRRHRLHQAR